jgi:hypothetical protein
MQAGQDSDGGVGGSERMCAASSGYVVVLVLGDNFNDSAPSTGVL